MLKPKTATIELKFEDDGSVTYTFKPGEALPPDTPKVGATSSSPALTLSPTEDSGLIWSGRPTGGFLAHSIVATFFTTPPGFPVSLVASAAPVDIIGDATVGYSVVEAGSKAKADAKQKQADEQKPDPTKVEPEHKK